MKPVSRAISWAALGLMLLAGSLTAAPARAEEAPTPQSCDVPDYLLASESALPSSRISCSSKLVKTVTPSSFSEFARPATAASITGFTA